MAHHTLIFNRISHILSFKLFELSSENTTHSLSFCLCRENVDRCRQNYCIFIENVSRDHDYKHQWLRLISFGMKNNWKMWGEHRLYVCWQAGVMSWQNFKVFGSDQWLSFTVPSSNNLFLSMFTVNTPCFYSETWNYLGSVWRQNSSLYQPRMLRTISNLCFVRA